MIQRLRNLPVPLRIVAYAAAAAALLAVAAGVGVMAALTLGPDGDSPEGAKPERVGEANPGQGGGQEDAAEEGAADGSSKASYLDEVADIQNGSVEVALQSNTKLLRYDGLNADDIEDMKANYAALGEYRDRVGDLVPPEGYERQHEVLVLAIDELYAANKLAYRLAADPASATQADFEAYDRHIQRATSYLGRSNEALGKDYKTTETARGVSF
jgi:hypothetical protein